MNSTISFQWRRYVLITPFYLLLTSISLCQDNLFLYLQSNSLDFPSLSEQDIRNSNQFNLQITNSLANDDQAYTLRLSIQGRGISIRSNPKAGDFYSFGSTSQITLFSSDLAPYFDLAHLEFSGYTLEQYLQNGLPEGIYTICFTIASTGIQRSGVSSNQACINLAVRRNLPPEIIAPFDNESLAYADQYLFQWFPRHISANPVVYKFLVFEKIEGITSAELLQYFRPVIEEKTFGLQFLYNSTHQILKPGKSYVAYVYCESLFNNIYFQNGGYSEPIEFELEKRKVSLLRTPQGEIPEPECFYPPSDVFINEFNAGMMGARSVFIELLVIGLKSGQTEYDLTNWILDDNNTFLSNPNAQTGHIRLGDCFEAIPRGSLVLIYDNNLVPSGINPSMDGLPNANGVYQIPFNHSCVSVVPSCPDSQSTHYDCDTITGPGSTWPYHALFDNSGDLIQLRRPDGVLEHALIWNAENFTLLESEKVLDFDSLAFSTGTGFAFTSGENWYNIQGFEVISSGQTTPGSGNSSSNADLIEDIKLITAYSPFYISCHQEFLGSSSWAIIDITGQTANSAFEVYLNGVKVISYTVSNPIQIQLDGPGNHIIKVKDLYYGCSDECIVEVPVECIPGTPCNDLNSCTSNDVLDEDCNCAGIPDDQVVFTVTLSSPETCDYCISTSPTDYDPLFSYFILQSITIELPTGGTEYLNEFDNLDDNRNQIFNFPYCFGCQGGDDLQLFLADLNAWIISNGYEGYVTTGSSWCGPNSIIFYDTNLSILQSGAQSNLGDNFIIYFDEENCTQGQGTAGYHITASLQDCGAPEPGNDEEVVQWVWSNGALQDNIFVISQADCYTVTVTCSDGCSYMAMFPAQGDCECVVGNPCILPGSVPAECRTGTYGINCNCIPDLFPDSDGDAICDEADICPGFNDLEDSDNDGVPDGCDICHGEDDNESFDPQDCEDYPCNEDTDIQVTTISQGACNYCLQVRDPEDPDKFPHDPFRYFKSASFIINGTPMQADLCSEWVLFDENGFEDGWSIWSPTNANAALLEDVTVAHQGFYSVELSGSSSGSGIVTAPIDLSSCCQFRLDFSYKSIGLEQSSQSLIIEASYDNGQNFSPLEVLYYGIDFDNGVWKNVSFYINNEQNVNSILRFASTATSFAHKIYLDDIKFSRISQMGYGCWSSPLLFGQITVK